MSSRSLFFIFVIPEGLTILRSIQVLMSKTVERPPWHAFLTVLGMELAHCAGVALLFFGAFPGMDTPTAMMAANAVALAPALLSVFKKEEGGGREGWRKIAFLVFDVLAVVVQVGRYSTNGPSKI